MANLKDLIVSGPIRAISGVIGDLTGTADKALKDGNGNTITSYYIPTARTVNSKALSSNIVLNGADLAITGYSKPSSTSALAATDTINVALGKLEKALDGKQASGNYVPTSRTVNSKALTDNITLNYSDVGAAASSHTHTSSDITNLSSTISTAISGKADKATSLSGYGISDAYTKTEIDGKLSGAMHFKGTKATVADLPSTGNTQGDMWNVTSTDANYAWDGSAWDKLSENIDLSGYVPTSRTVNGKALSGNISLTASDVGAATSGHTHSVFVKSGTGAAAGFVPAPSTTAGTTKYLREDGTWVVPPGTYTHPTTSGNKHIPSGGSSGQILRWSADGTATWGADSNTTYSAGSGLSLSGTTFNHSNSVTAGTAGTSSATSGSTLAVPYVTYDAQGHVTATGTHTHTVTGFAASDHNHDITYQYWVKKTIDLSNTTTYADTTWFPVTGTTLQGADMRRILVDVELNSGTKPSWSTHNLGFSVILDMFAIGSGWGTTTAASVCLQQSASWVTDASKPPASFSQMNNSSTPVLWLRGGGKYFVWTNYACDWTPRTSTYTVSSQSVTPTTTYPALSFTRSTIWANLNGNATTASKLGSTTVGGTTTPIYLNNGTPTALSYTIAKSVPSDALFTDTVYTHPTTSGNKHIPSGGSSGQILKWSADGTATWAAEYSYTHPTTSGNKHIPSGGSSGQFLKWSADGTATWAADNDTKNTAGSTDTSSKIFLVGATSQAANPQTYSHDTVFVDTDGMLNSATPTAGNSSTKVATTAFVGTALGSYLPLAGGTVTGTTVFSKSQDLSGTANNSPALIVGGAVTAEHLELDGNEIHAKANGTTVGTLYLNNDGGLVQTGSGGIKTTGGLQVGSTATITGATTHAAAVNFANNTWNSMGDDAAIGDCNVGGHIGVKQLNGSSCGFQFYNSSGTALSQLNANSSNITSSGSLGINNNAAKMQYNSTTEAIEFVFA